MSFQTLQALDELPIIRADLNYLNDTVDRPRTYTFEAPAGEP
jgi:hypothetical protein